VRVSSPRARRALARPRWRPSIERPRLQIGPRNHHARPVSGHGLVTYATDVPLPNVTISNCSPVFPQVSGRDGTDQHHSAWWSRNISGSPATNRTTADQHLYSSAERPTRRSLAGPSARRCGRRKTDPRSGRGSRRPDPRGPEAAEVSLTAIARSARPIDPRAQFRHRDPEQLAGVGLLVALTGQIEPTEQPLMRISDADLLHAAPAIEVELLPGFIVGRDHLDDQRRGRDPDGRREAAVVATVGNPVVVGLAEVERPGPDQASRPGEGTEQFRQEVVNISVPGMRGGERCDTRPPRPRRKGPGPGRAAVRAAPPAPPGVRRARPSSRPSYYGCRGNRLTPPVEADPESAASTSKTSMKASG